MKYKAFISYSHKDEKFAKWLHKKLESYKIPKELYAEHPHLPKKIFPIFRDVEELSASSDLPKEILEALDDSEYLIVICSLHSAQSKWVNQEIVDFKLIHGEERVLSIILEGEPHAKENDKLDSRLECFPEALKYKIVNRKISKEKAEPIAADVRGTWRSEWEFGKLKLISGLLELDFEELNKREEKRRRKSRFIWGVLSLLIIASLSGLAWYSFVQKEKTEEQRDKAKSNLEIFNSLNLLKTDATESLKYALIAWHLSSNNIKAHKAVLRAYYEPNAFPVRLAIKGKTSSDMSDSWFGASFSADSKKILSYDYEKLNTLYIFNIDGKRDEIKLEEPLSGYSPFAIYSSQGHYMLTLHRQRDVVILRDNFGKKIREFKYNNIEKAIFSKDEKKIAIAGEENDKYSVVIYDLNGTRIEKIDDFTNSINDMKFSPDGKTLIVGADKALWIKSLVDNKSWNISHPDYVTGVTFSPDGKTIATTCWDGLPRLWYLDSKKLIKSYKGHTSRVYSPTFSPDGKWLATASWDGTIGIWYGTPNIPDTMVKKIFARKNSFGSGFNTVSWSPNGRWLVTTGDKALTLWDMKTKRYEENISLTSLKYDKLYNWDKEVYSLQNGYRGIETFYNNKFLRKLKIEFNDTIYRGKFSKDGLYVLVNQFPIGKRAYPFHPQVIENLVFKSMRFGPMKTKKEPQ